MHRGDFEGAAPGIVSAPRKLKFPRFSAAGVLFFQAVLKHGGI